MHCNFVASRAAAFFIASFAVVVLASCQTVSAVEKILLAEGLNNPESAVVGEDGRIYVTITGKPDADADGQVVAIQDGKATVIAQGMSDPRGIGRKGKQFFIADKTKVWRIDDAGQLSVFADTDAFPVKPFFLNDIEVGPDGDVYVSESGTFVANGAVYRIKPDGKVSTVCDTKTLPGSRARTVCWPMVRIICSWPTSPAAECIASIWPSGPESKSPRASAAPMAWCAMRREESTSATCAAAKSSGSTVRRKARRLCRGFQIGSRYRAG